METTTKRSKDAPIRGGEPAWHQRQSAMAVVRWLRREARAFERMAERIERACSKQRVGSLEPAAVDVEAMRETMSQKAMRMADLVKRFSVPDRELRKILSDPENGFEIGAQGWIRLKQPQGTLDESRQRDSV